MQKMWFGNEQHAQWVPCPAQGMQRTMNRRAEEFLTFSGGLWMDYSAAGFASYQMDFPAKPKDEYEGIEAFDRFISGEYGEGFLHFIDPRRADENLFNAAWAAPGLIEAGWKSIYDTEPTFSDTGANTYGKPMRKATFALSGVANAVPTKPNSSFTLLIPPSHKVVIGASGAATGTGVLRVQPVNLDGTLAAVVNIALSADSAAPALTSSFSGATYKAVRVYLSQTTAGAATLTLSALWAQCVLLSRAPVLTRHIPGKGHSGLMFRPAQQVETYGGGSKVGASISIAEVQPWAPSSI